MVNVSAPRTVETATAVKPARIAAMSTAFALHVVVFGLLAIPITTPLENLPRVIDERMTWVEPVVEKPKPLPIVQPPIDIAPPKPKPTPVVVPQPLPAPVFESVALPEPAVVAPPAETVVEAPSAPSDVAGLPTGGSESVTVLFGPQPRYPVAAARKHLEGTVVLRILIGANGLPLEVDVEESSGHRVLDDAARKAVQKWRFAPAMRNGAAVQSVGTLPVVFSLARG